MSCIYGQMGDFIIHTGRYSPIEPRGYPLSFLISIIVVHSNKRLRPQQAISISGSNGQGAAPSLIYGHPGTCTTGLVAYHHAVRTFTEAL